MKISSPIYKPIVWILLQSCYSFFPHSSDKYNMNPATLILHKKQNNW